MAVRKKAKKKTAKKTAKKTTAKKSTAKKSDKKAAGKKSATKKVSGPVAKAAKGKVGLGKKVPDFSAPATGDKTLSLKDFKGKNLVIYFYPKDSTPGCTREGLDFTDLHKKFQRAKTEILGVSRDSLKSHENFKAKQGYSFDLLSDPDESLCQLFDVIKMKNMYGRQVRGIERSTFLIDKNGKLVKEWRKVKVPDHAEEVLAAAKELK